MHIQTGFVVCHESSSLSTSLSTSSSSPRHERTTERTPPTTRGLLSKHIASSLSEFNKMDINNKAADNTTGIKMNSTVKPPHHKGRGVRMVVDCKRYHVSHFQGTSCDWCFAPKSGNSSQKPRSLTCMCPNGCRVYFCSDACTMGSYRQCLVLHSRRDPGLY